MWDIVAHMPEFRETVRGGRVSRAFAEKIMMAVTQVNGCRYCAYFHTKMALREGIPPDDLEKLLALELGHFPQEEAVAVLDEVVKLLILPRDISISSLDDLIILIAGVSNKLMTLNDHNSAGLFAKTALTLSEFRNRDFNK